MNNFRPSLILIVNCIVPLALSQNPIRNYNYENLSLRDVKERTFNILKTLVNIRYSWSQYERTCGTKLDVKIDFLNEKSIINMMTQEINDTSTSLSKAANRMQKSLKLFLEAKKKLSPDTLNFCFNPEGDMYREWILTELNKDLKLEQQDRIRQTLENSVVLLELYKFVNKSAKRNGADANFINLTTNLTSIIKIYEENKGKSISIRKKNHLFHKVKTFVQRIYVLYYTFLSFNVLDKEISNIFNKIYDDNEKNTWFTEAPQLYKNENGSNSILPATDVFFQTKKTDDGKNNDKSIETAKIKNNTRTTINVKKKKPNAKTTMESSTEQKIQSAVKYIGVLFAVKYFLLKILQK